MSMLLHLFQHLEFDMGVVGKLQNIPRMDHLSHPFVVPRIFEYCEHSSNPLDIQLVLLLSFQLSLLLAESN